MGKTSYGPWKASPVCVKCEGKICRQTLYYGGGICPHCGHDANSTIADTKNIVYRYVTTKTGKWWQFWKTESYIEFKTCQPKADGIS